MSKAVLAISSSQSHAKSFQCLTNFSHADGVAEGTILCTYARICKSLSSAVGSATSVVAELMLFATKAVLHPTAPLYDTSTHELKLACVRALTRIFALSDGNQDGVLDESELKSTRSAIGAASRL